MRIRAELARLIHFRRRGSLVNKPETTSPLPPPDLFRPAIIDGETDQFRFYPGRREYILEWNMHVTSSEGLRLQREVYDAGLRREASEVQTAAFREELEQTYWQAEMDLEEFHETWVLFGGDGKRAIFYAADHLQGNQKAREDLFVRFVELHRKPLNQLGRLFLGFAELVKTVEPGFTQLDSPSASKYFDEAEEVWQRRHPEDR